MPLGQHRYVKADTDGHGIATFNGDVPRIGDEVSICDGKTDAWYIVARVLWVDDYQWSPPTHRAMVYLRRLSA